MSERQAPGLHRIEVERDRDGEVSSVRFACDGTNLSACHSFPECACETWGEVTHGDPPAPGHENVVHEKECWVDPWFNAALSDAGDWVEAYDGEHDGLDEADLRSAQIETTFEGDYMTWRYADEIPDAS